VFPWIKSPSLGSRSRYALASLAGQLVFALLFFGASVLAARLLGPTGKGEYTAWTLGSVILAVALAGSIPTGLGRAYLQSERAALLPIAVRHGALTLGVVALGIIPAILLGVNSAALVFCILIAVPATVVVNDILVVMQAAKRPWSYQAIRIATAGIVVAGMTGLVITSPENPLDIAFGVWAVAALASGLAAALIAYRHLGARRRRGTLRTFGRLGGRSYFANLIDFLLFRVDQLIVVAIAGPLGLGLYSVAVNWSEICGYVGASIGQAAFEDQRTLGRDAARRILYRASWILSLMTIAVAFAGFVLITPIFGEQFEEARWALLLLAPGVVAKGLAYTGVQILQARGAGWVVSRIMMMTLVVGLPAWAGLTYVAGIEGAAGATTGVYLMQMLLTLRALLGEP
jgi:antigen flippase